MPESDKPSLLGSIALIVVGLLILIPSGLCTGLGLISGVMAAIQSPGRLMFTLPILVLGGPFVLGGGALVWNGIRRLRVRNAPRDEGDTF